MCQVWQNPTVRSEEVSLETLNKVPYGIDYLNLTGGEPTLRDDLMEVVDLLYPRAMQLEISSNGLHPERLEPIIRKYPSVKIRFSMDGMGELNDRIRGEQHGFKTKTAGLLKLKELGGRDLGFATVIQDDNASDLVAIFQFCRQHEMEMATSALHNAFQFHKNDNLPYDRLKVAKQIEGLITAQLRTWDVKTWFRGYVNLGLIAKVLGQDRLLPCTAGTSFVFIDPWGDMFACNVRPDLKMGNLQKQSWDEILHGPLAASIRARVAQCKQNCWMVGSAKTAMRHPKLTKIPRLGPLLWVLQNKIRATLRLRIPFEQSVDYCHVFKDLQVPRRVSYLNQSPRRKAQRMDEPHYTPFGEFTNR